MRLFSLWALIGGKSAGGLRRARESLTLQTFLPAPLVKTLKPGNTAIMTREEVIKVVDEARASIRRPDLRGADLRRVNLSGVNLHGADFTNADLQGANLREANLARADLFDADLQGANLEDANLQGANLQYANLSEANLTQANLSSTDLTYTILEGADLTGANLTGSWPSHKVPKVESLVGKILDADCLDMLNWHSECGTTHCLAGWATTLAGKAGAELEKKLGTEAAGALIWRASTGEIPDFYADNEDAKAWLLERVNR